MAAKKATPQRRLEVAYIDGFYLTRLAPARWQESVRNGLTEAHFTCPDTKAGYRAISALFGSNPSTIDTTLLSDACAAVDSAEVERLIEDRPSNAVNFAGTIKRLVSEHDKRRIADGLRNAITGIDKAADTDTALLLARLAYEKILATTNTGTPATTVNASEWLQEPDEPEQPIIHGLFDAGDRVAIVGQPKARKSFYALLLAIAVETGIAFLGLPTVKQRVLLINGEIAARSYKKRLRRMAARLSIDPASLDGLIILNASELSEAGGFAEILALAKKHAATVVIVDPAYLLLGDEIDQQQVKQSVRDMKRFAPEGITLVSVFHAAKGKIGDRQAIDRISGSGIFARDASTMISLCEHASEPDHVVVTAITRNYPPSEPTTIMFEDGAFVLTDVAAIEKTSMTKTARVIPSEDVANCFSSVKVNYADAVKAVQLRLGVGIGKAKELIASSVSDGSVKSQKDWRTTLYFKG